MFTNHCYSFSKIYDLQWFPPLNFPLAKAEKFRVFFPLIPPGFWNDNKKWQEFFLGNFQMTKKLVESAGKNGNEQGGCWIIQKFLECPFSLTLSRNHHKQGAGSKSPACLAVNGPPYQGQSDWRADRSSLPTLSGPSPRGRSAKVPTVPRLCFNLFLILNSH